MSVLLVFTWLVTGQPPVTTKLEMPTYEACEKVRDRMQIDSGNVKMEPRPVMLAYCISR